jgi:dihydrofolate synthase/folylpolyglutamate synthase
MTASDEITRHLFSLNARGIKYDLNRMKRAVARLGNPEYACPCFHVAGTNGKGSVCAYLEAMLRRAGFKTGLFTSPHLIRFEERFLINGLPVESRAWVDVYGALQPMIEELHLTFFEAAALMAFELFKRERVEWAVYETGLGGRLDATNVVIPRVSIITSIDIDHQELLGNDLLSIAGEKLGIVKHRTPLVMAFPRDAGVRDSALIYALRNETTVNFVDEREAVDPTFTGHDGISFLWHGQRFAAGTNGDYQAQNALLALNGLIAAGFMDLTAMGKGLGNARLPGRFQIVEARGKTVVFDVGHNAQAVSRFCNAFAGKFERERVCCVIGIMKDKDIAGMMPHFAPISAHMILTAPAIDRAASPETLLKAFPADYAGSAIGVADLPKAVETAFAGDEDIVCIAGSFHTVGEAMAILGIEPYQ